MANKFNRFAAVQALCHQLLLHLCGEGMHGFKNFISTSTPYVEQGGKPPLAIKFKENKLQVACTGAMIHVGFVTNTFLEVTQNGGYHCPIWILQASDSTWWYVSWWLLNTRVGHVWSWCEMAMADFMAGRNGVNKLGSVIVVDVTDSKGTKHPINEEDLQLTERNDILGYYFKFRCYRYSTEPFCTCTKDYKQN